MSGLPSYPVYPGVGAILKGPDSETIIKGPDGSVITAAAEGGAVVAKNEKPDLPFAPIVVAEPEPEYKVPIPIHDNNSKPKSLPCYLFVLVVE